MGSNGAFLVLSYLRVNPYATFSSVVALIVLTKFRAIRCCVAHARVICGEESGIMNAFPVWLLLIA